MTQQDDITQRVLTDDEIREVIFNAIGFGFDSGELQSVNADDLMKIAHDLLSKVPAPVADSTLRLEQALHELIDKIVPGLDTGDLVQDARRASTALSAILASAPVAITELRIEFTAGGVGYVSIESARAAVLAASRASAPVAVEPHDGLRTLLAELPGMHEDPKKGDAVFRCGVNGALNVVERRIRELLRSAPVAGEAQSPTDDELRDLAVKYDVSQDAMRRWHFRDVVPLLREALALYAAPQASTEDVRNADAAMAAEYQQWINWFHKGRDYDSFLKECVFNKPQADKDGGQWEPQTPEQIAAAMRNMARSEGFDWPEPDDGQQREGGSHENA